MKSFKVIFSTLILVHLTGCSSPVEYSLDEVTIRSGTYFRYDDDNSQHPHKIEINGDSTLTYTNPNNVRTNGRIQVSYDGKLRIGTEEPLFHVWVIVKSEDDGFYLHSHEEKWVRQ